jgi:putative Holliday junction resolvase
MGKIVGIDYGSKQVGLSITDSLQIIASGLATVPNRGIIPYLKELAVKHRIDAFVLGEPRHLNNEMSEMAVKVHAFGEILRQNFPEIPVHFIDERFTSKIAAHSLVQSGAKKKTRRNKTLLDEISATLILQSYLEQKAFGK